MRRALVVVLLALATTVSAQEPVDRVAIARIKDEGLNRSRAAELFNHLTNVIGGPYVRPRTSPVIDVTGGPQAYAAPGELVFRVGAREFTLVAFADSSSKDFLVMFADSTNRDVTYPAGRYMRVTFPDQDGWTLIDFNRAYNPPCAFTPYSTCALPPDDNRLAFSIPVGEKRAH